MKSERPEVAPLQAPLGDLERTLIDEFLHAHGYDAHGLASLADETRQALLAEASVYASAKLAEISSRSHFLHDIHSAGERPRPHANETGGSSESPFAKPAR